MRTYKGYGAARVAYIAALALALFFIVLLLIFIVHTLPDFRHATNHVHNQPPHESADKESRSFPFWYPSDAIGLYTLLLAVFTGALVVVSYRQWAALVRTDKTARTAAAAALATARAAIAQTRHMETHAAETGRLAGANETANKISQQSLVLSQRAWLQADISIVGPLTFGTLFGDTICSVSLVITLKNIGKSVATQVFLMQELMFLRLADDPNREWQEIAQKQANMSDLGKNGWHSPLLDELVFPGDAQQHTIKIQGRHRPQDGAVYKMNAINIIFLGCVDYDFPSGAGHHQTWFSGELRERENPNRLLVPGKDIAAEDLVLIRNPYAKQYAD